MYFSKNHARIATVGVSVVIKGLKMKIFPIQFLNKNTINKQEQKLSSFQNSYFCPQSTLKNDIFFTSSNTSQGVSLKRLKNIKCPYCGVEIMPRNEFKKALKELKPCKNIKEITKVLRRYSKYMHKTEKEIYRAFLKYAKINPEGTLNDCLASLYDEAIIRLKLEEFGVLDDVDKISLNLKPQNALKVHKKTTTCRQIILQNQEGEKFKRKTLLSSLYDIPIEENEKETFEKLLYRASYLPTSSDSFNAFVVKYKDRSQEEIAKRIIMPSIASIEHIKPDSLGGANEMSNFILASGGANSARSSIPLDKFIERYPSIVKRCQVYIDQIIDAIHQGRLKHQYSYPYNVKDVLFEESNGIINLDLSRYKYSKEKALELDKTE